MDDLGWGTGFPEKFSDSMKEIRRVASFIFHDFFRLHPTVSSSSTVFHTSSRFFRKKCLVSLRSRIFRAFWILYVLNHNFFRMIEDVRTLRRSTPQAIPFLTVYNMLSLPLLQTLKIAFGGRIVRKSERGRQIRLCFHSCSNSERIWMTLFSLESAFSSLTNAIRSAVNMREKEAKIGFRLMMN